MDKRESVGWTIGALGGVIAILASAGAYHIYMDARHEPRGEASAIGATLLMVIKNIQYGRLASYDKPAAELSTEEKQRKLIIEYDLKNIEQIEQAVGLESPDAGDVD